MFQMSIFSQNYLLLAGTWTSISYSSVVTRSDNPVPLNAITEVSTEPLKPQGHARGIHKASPGWRLQRKGRCNCAGTSSTARDVIGVGWPWRNWRLCYFKRNDAYQIGAREHRVSNMKPLLGHVSRMLIVLVELIVSSSGGSQYLYVLLLAYTYFNRASEHGSKCNHTSTVRYIRACGQSQPPPPKGTHYKWYGANVLHVPRPAARPRSIGPLQ